MRNAESLTSWWARGRKYPRLVVNNRERNRRWCEKHRNVRNRQPWLLGAFPYVEYLPGGALPMRLRPAPDRPRLEHSRHVHGMLSSLHGKGHDPHTADFALVPWRDGWGVYFRDQESALMLAAKSFDVKLWGQAARVAFGPMHRLKAPIVTRRGRQRVRVDAVSPVCIRESAKGMYTAPTADALRSTLEAWQARRIGVDCQPGHLKVELVERQTFAATTQLGGKYGVVRGWVGHVVLDVNAPSLWLLRTAAQIGLGGRTAFGFGRVNITEVTW